MKDVRREIQDMGNEMITSLAEVAQRTAEDGDQEISSLMFRLCDPNRRRLPLVLPLAIGVAGSSEGEGAEVGGEGLAPGENVGGGRSRSADTYLSASGEAGLGKKKGAAYGSVRVTARLLLKSFSFSCSFPLLFSFRVSFLTRLAFSDPRGLDSNESKRRGSEMSVVRIERMLILW